MIRKFLGCLLVMIWLLCSSFTWYPGPDHTVAWDEVTETVLGDPISEQHTVFYEVFIYKYETGDLFTFGITEQTEMDISLVGYQGKFIVGVQAILATVVDEEWVILARSAVAWSHDPIVCYNGETFALVFYDDPSGV